MKDKFVNVNVITNHTSIHKLIVFSFLCIYIYWYDNMINHKINNIFSITNMKDILIKMLP